MKVAFVRSFIPEYDARLKKYLSALEREGAESVFIGWDKKRTYSRLTEKERIFKYPGALGGRWKNALGIFLWNFYILAMLWRLRREVDAIHAIDLDSAVLPWLFCKIFRKVMIFDIYDHYAETRNIRGFMGRLLSGVERFIAKRSSLTFLADECRFQQHQINKNLPNIRVLENVPDFRWNPLPLKLLSESPIRLGYFGVLEPGNRGLETILEAFSGEPGVELHFAGYGPLQDYVSMMAEKFQNVQYYGPMRHEDGIRLLEGMHCVFGFYSLSVPNHKYAAPNKYYEHLFLGRPLLTTRDTPPGYKVADQETGWALAEGEQPLLEWLSNVKDIEIERRARNARMIWDKHYNGYSEKHVIYGYLEMLKKAIDKNGKTR